MANESLEYVECIMSIISQQEWMDNSKIVYDVFYSTQTHHIQTEIKTIVLNKDKFEVSLQTMNIKPYWPSEENNKCETVKDLNHVQLDFVILFIAKGNTTIDLEKNRKEHSIYYEWNYLEPVLKEQRYEQQCLSQEVRTLASFSDYTSFHKYSKNEGDPNDICLSEPQTQQTK